MELETLLSRISDNTSIFDTYGASHFPIYQSGTFDLKKQSGENKYDYSRSGNPTRSVLEEIFAKAESGVNCVCTNTGVAAIALLFETVLKTGDNVLTEIDLYGGTNRILNIISEKYAISSSRVDLTNFEEVETLLKMGSYKLVFCESPTNPGMKMVDIMELSNLCKKYSVLLAVDNSLATFASQKPLELGADFSVFSATKFISGHGATISGAVINKDSRWTEQLRYLANAEGRTQSPFEVFLLTLGLPTLVVRMKQQEATALSIAGYLSSSDKVKKVSFPFLPDHPRYDLAKRQMKICPAVMTIDLYSEAHAEQFIQRLKLFGEKASFGNYDSRAEQPSKISHASYTEEQLRVVGITKSTVRLSIGLESLSDLLADIQRVLDSLV